MTTYASAVLTSATSADMPNTPTTLANCAIGSTVVWLYPSSSHGKPLQKYVRASSVVTQTAGASRIARRPVLSAEPPEGQREQRGKQREVRNEDRGHDHADRGRQSTELCDDRAGPVHRAAEISHAGDKAGQEAAALSGPGRGANSGTMSGASATHAKMGWP